MGRRVRAGQACTGQRQQWAAAPPPACSPTECRAARPCWVRWIARQRWREPRMTHRDCHVVLQTGAKPNERRQCGERRDAVRAQVRRGAGRLWRGCAVLGKSRVVCRGCNLYRGSKFADDSLVLSAPRPRPADVAAVATGVAAPLDSTTSANGTGGTRAAIIHDPTALAELRGPFAAALTTGQTAPSGVVEVWGGRLCACKCGWPTLTG